jgi:hypothetical protein
MFVLITNFEVTIIATKIFIIYLTTLSVAQST